MYSAGMLIYTVRNNEIYLLLGRDAKYKTWSDFGGKNEYIDDNDSRKTACRECFEETCGVLYDRDILFSKIENIQPFKCESYMKNDYYMYPIHVDEVNFETIENDFYTIRQNLDSLNTISYKYKEKDIIKWIKLCNVSERPDDYRCVFYKSLQENITNIEKCVSI